MIEKRHNEDGKPCHKEFWPWFIVCLMGTVMTACLVTVYIAISGADQVVSDNYYKDGLKINQDLEKDQRAKALNLSAQISLDQHSFNITLSQPIVQTIILKFIHPVEQAMDFSLELNSADQQHFSGELENPLSGRWYLEIGDSGELWRLKSVSNNIELQQQLSFTSP